MKLFISQILNISLFLTFFNMSSQKDMISCLTETPENYLEIENQYKSTYDYHINTYYDKLNQKTSTAITNIPAKIHIVTDANGVTSITLDEILDEINEANTFLATSFLEINVCDEVNYIANNLLYNFDIDDQQTLYANNQADILNIYFVESIAFGGGNACGYTYVPPVSNSSQYYDVIVMDNQCTNNPVSTTLIHEFGHHFALEHTHGLSNSELTDELVNGSNCTTAGDRLCDTPADPQLNSSNVSSVNCMYTGTATDALGQQFDPDTSNIMSYSPNTCTDFISQQQYARMYAGYHTYKSYYKCPSFNVDFSAEKTESCDDYMTVDFTDTSVGATAWEWDINGDDIVDYTEQNPSHVYTPGMYDVALKIYNGSESITKVFPQFVNFSSNIHETSMVNLKLFIVDINENTWEFKNSEGDILYSGGPYSEMNEYNYEFDISDGDCYSFIIYDYAGNGLANTSWTVGGGPEFYELTTENGSIIQLNNDFGFEELTLINNQFMSLNEINFNNQVDLFPNPSDDYIEIRYQNILPNSFKIFDLNGRLINSKIINSYDDLKINVGSFEKGLYFISIKSDKNVYNLKFLVK